MNKVNFATTVAFSIIIVAFIAAVTVIIITEHDPTAVIGVLSSAILPTAVALWAGNKASKAADSAQQASDNTNGRLTQLIELLDKRGVKVDTEEYADVLPPNYSK